jgi:hypothetical protein
MESAAQKLMTIGKAPNQTVMMGTSMSSGVPRKADR